MKDIQVSIPDDIDEIMNEVARDTHLRRAAIDRFAIEEFARDHRFLHSDHYKVQFLKRAVAK